MNCITHCCMYSRGDMMFQPILFSMSSHIKFNIMSTVWRRPNILFYPPDVYVVIYCFDSIICNDLHTGRCHHYWNLPKAININMPWKIKQQTKLRLSKNYILIVCKLINFSNKNIKHIGSFHLLSN